MLLKTCCDHLRFSYLFRTWMQFTVDSEHHDMAVLIFESPALVSTGPRDKCPHQVGPGGPRTFISVETTHAAVLFADMRGYTALAERLQPARVVCLLDEFFTALSRVTVAFGGEVFHMAGDGMMAGFGVRDPKRLGACAALAAGRAMLRSFAPVAARWRDEFAVVTGIGIGLHSGEVALGFLGPPGKRAITMIGDTANVAARLCSRACAGEVLFSCAVAAALRADAGGVGLGAKAFLQLPQFELRGRSKLLDIWCVPAPETSSSSSVVSLNTQGWRVIASPERARRG